MKRITFYVDQYNHRLADIRKRLNNEIITPDDAINLIEETENIFSELMVQDDEVWFTDFGRFIEQCQIIREQFKKSGEIQEVDIYEITDEIA